MERASDGFKLLCVIALVLGLAGMCCDLFSMGDLLLTDEIAPINEQLIVEAEARRPYRPWVLLFGCLQFTQGFVVALGAALTLREYQRGRRILAFALKSGLVIAPLALVVGLAAQFLSKAAVLEQEHVHASFGSIIEWSSVLVGTGWMAVKLAIYVVLLRALRKQVVD